MTQRRGPSTRTLAAVAVVALQLAVCLAVVLAPLDARPHGARVGIVAPPIVATALAQQANALDGRPVRAEALRSAGAARAEVRDGRSEAALVVDVRSNRAVLMVSSAQGSGVVEGLVEVARSLAGRFSADVEVRDIAPEPDGSAGRRGVFAAIGASVVTGLAIAVVLTWRRGPVADTWREAWRRMATGAAVSALVSLAVALVASHAVGGDLATWWFCSVLAASATCAATMALEGLLGVAGIGVGVTVLVIAGAPLLRVGHPLLLPTPWGDLVGWLPLGAALRAGAQIAFFDSAAVVQPLTVLVAWLLVSLVALAVARRERRRAGVVWDATRATGS